MYVSCREWNVVTEQTVWDTEVKQQGKMSNKKLHSGVPMPEILSTHSDILLGKSHGQRSLGRL